MVALRLCVTSFVNNGRQLITRHDGLARVDTSAAAETCNGENKSSILAHSCFFFVGVQASL